MRDVMHWRRILLVGLLLCGTAMAGGSGGSFRISRDVIASGGANVSGGSYVLVGTVAQPLAQSPISTAPYRLQAGFHVPRTPRPDALFANGFESP